MNHSETNRAHLQSLKRSQIQRLCKSNNLRPGGNRKTNELIDLLVAHFDQQGRSAESLGSASNRHSPAIQTATPAPSVHSQDENREPSDKLQTVSRTATDSQSLVEQEKHKPSGSLQLDDHPSPIAESSTQSTDSRIAALESLCTRLTTQNSTFAIMVAKLQSSLELAEQSISSLTGTLQDTRFQLESAQSQIGALRSSLTASDQLVIETNATLTAQLSASQENAALAYGRLDALAARIEHLEDTRTSSHRSGNPAMPEASGSIAKQWMQNLSPRNDMHDRDSSFPSSSRHKNMVMLGRTTRSDFLVPTSTSWPIGISPTPHTPMLNDPFSVPPQGETSRVATMLPFTSKAAGKRPASPTSGLAPGYIDGEPLKKRLRNSIETPNWSEPTNTEVSPSLVSYSLDSAIDNDSPSNPTSLSAEPVTPPRRAALLPPVEIITTPSPSGSRQLASIRKGSLVDQSHYFATTPRPPHEAGPSSPTTQSPRKGSVVESRSMNPSTRRLEFKRREKDRDSLFPATPPPIVIGKGRTLRAQLDPGTASAVRLIRRSASIDEDGDTPIGELDSPSVDRDLRSQIIEDSPHTLQSFAAGLLVGGSNPRHSMSVSDAEGTTPVRRADTSSEMRTVNPNFPPPPNIPSTMSALLQPSRHSSQSRSNLRHSTSPLIPHYALDPPIPIVADLPTRDYAADPEEAEEEAASRGPTRESSIMNVDDPHSNHDRDMARPAVSGSTIRGPSQAKRSFWAKWRSDQALDDDGWMKTWAR